MIKKIIQNLFDNNRYGGTVSVGSIIIFFILLFVAFFMSK